MVNKVQLKEYCLSLIRQRINVLVKGMDEAQAAANEETKSSAGDKYETGRAMNQLEKDMLARQLAENKKELAAIATIDVSGAHSMARAGSLVRCDDAAFFLMAGLGKLVYQGHTIYVISPQAPLAQAMLGKEPGNSFQFNNRTMVIRELY